MAATLANNVNTGYDEPDVTMFELWQVMTWATAAQDQPVPEPGVAAGVSPDGNVSTTVTGFEPEVSPLDPGPLFVTVTV